MENKKETKLNWDFIISTLVALLFGSIFGGFFIMSFILIDKEKEENLVRDNQIEYIQKGIYENDEVYIEELDKKHEYLVVTEEGQKIVFIEQEESGKYKETIKDLEE